MAGESSFDVVSKIDHQEVDNAVNQAAKEVGQRFDFKGTGASIRWSGEAVELEADSEDRLNAVLDVFQSKLVRRGINLKALDAGAPRVSGKIFKITCTLTEGISQENAKKVSKLVRRGVNLKALDAGEPRHSGKVFKITCTLTEGISQENAKRVSKLVRDEGPKGVKVQIQGDELRVSSKSRDDLQAVQQLIKAQDFDFATQFTNYR